mmetsp:Transcript_44214/g.137707  ORF Transcript_44214/g.137707 Transcript_44214/m.137707 type:complete len:216 (-) Transcript_44214:139-786(-)
MRGCLLGDGHLVRVAVRRTSAAVDELLHAHFAHAVEQPVGVGRDVQVVLEGILRALTDKRYGSKVYHQVNPRVRQRLVHVRGTPKVAEQETQLPGLRERAQHVYGALVPAAEVVDHSHCVPGFHQHEGGMAADEPSPPGHQHMEATFSRRDDRRVGPWDAAARCLARGDEKRRHDERRQRKAEQQKADFWGTPAVVTVPDVGPCAIDDALLLTAT